MATKHCSSCLYVFIEKNPEGEGCPVCGSMEESVAFTDEEEQGRTMPNRWVTNVAYTFLTILVLSAFIFSFIIDLAANDKRIAQKAQMREAYAKQHDWVVTMHDKSYISDTPVNPTDGYFIEKGTGKQIVCWNAGFTIERVSQDGP